MLHHLNFGKKSKILLAAGIFITIVGFILHFYYPSEMITSTVNENSTFEELETYDGILLKPEINDSNYQFRIDLMVSGYSNSSLNSNFTILILDLAEYGKLENGTELEDLNPIKIIKKTNDPYMGQPTHRTTVIFKEAKSIYVLVINNDIFPLNIYISYYYSVIHPLYYIGIIIAIIGTMLVFSVLIIYFTGWLRYFLLGSSINVFAFFLRVATLPAFFGHPIMYYLTIEMYSDYQTWYMGWSVPFKEGIWLYSNEMIGYIYGPLYLLTIGPFSYFPHAWGMGIPLCLFGIGTGLLVYKIMYKLTKNEKMATIATLIYFLNPFTLLYSSFTWLNPSIYTFFVVLSFYFLLNNRNAYSLLSMGIATMYKQFAVIFFPLILIYLLRKNNQIKLINKFKNTVKFICLYCSPILLISLPFLIYDYQLYLDRVFFNNTMFSPEQLNWVVYHLGVGVKLMDPILLLGGANNFTLVINYLVAYYIPLGVSFGLIYISFLRFKYNKNNKTSSNELFIRMLYLSIFLIIIVQIFYPRGSYKFYLILLAPFVSMFFDYRNFSLRNNENNILKPRFIIPLIISWGIFFCFRYAYFLILILWMFFLIYMNKKYKPTGVTQLL
ncbi:MAG: hypothetical protein ACFFC3_04830 [Candidatus Odinarchaeota archaeon]